MVRKQSFCGALVLCLFAVAGSLPAFEKTVELGKESLWTGMQTMDGVTMVPGRWGFQDLVLTSGEYPPDSATELLLHFEPGAAGADAAGSYSLTGAAPVISESTAAMGSGSAAFTGGKQGVGFQAPPEGLFAAGATWGDFAIEFWLYPATLTNGETIVSWAGATKDGTGAEAKLGSQGLRCFIRDRKLVWDFQNLFTLPRAGSGAGERLPVTLVGTTSLLPRAWHHHLLRYDSREGLLEYRIDGIPEAIAHMTDTGRENGSIAVPMVGQAYAGPLVLGPGYTGCIDELRISRRAVDDPVLSRFLARTGAATTRIIDLGFSSTRVARIEAVADTPSDTSVEYYYQAADVWNGKKLLKGDTDWVPFTPNADLRETLKARYLQLRVELYPNGARSQSPRVSDLKVVYEPNLPPVAPAGLVATAGNGTVTLTWRKVNGLNVKGYLVYYGREPHNYLGTGATPGDSPIDAGPATTLAITGLENGSLYYFAVTAYDDSSPRQESQFSAETSARPSRIYK